MTSQIIFRIDKKVKDKAMKKAEREGVPFASVLKFATKAYADNQLNVGIFPEERFNAKTRRELDRALKDIREGKDISPMFQTAEAAIAYLKAF